MKDVDFNTIEKPFKCFKPLKLNFRRTSETSQLM